jgi:hypothetical protein
VDTSYKGIEEIAREVMQLLHELGVKAADRERPVSQ